MTTPLRLRTSDMSPISEENAISSPRTPARGRETRDMLLQKLRPPQLVHAWDCWIERSPNRSPPKTPDTTASSATTTATTATMTVLAATATATATTKHKPHLTHLSSITDVRAFWSLFNNLPLSSLPARTTCYLFHQSIAPVWEDARNARGGAWTFRIPHENGPTFFEEICLLAVGEVLQGAVEDEERMFFRDDICGISFSPRAAGYTLVSVWNRDGDNAEGIKGILEVILEKVAPEVRPKEGSWYYKKHAEHPDFVPPTALAHANGSETGPAKEFDVKGTASGIENPVKETEGKVSGPAATMAHIEDDVRKVRKILKELKVAGGGAQTTGAAGEVEGN